MSLPAHPSAQHRDPFTSLAVVGVACKENEKEGWLTLLDSQHSVACQKELCQVHKWQENKPEKEKSKMGWEPTHTFVLGLGVGRRKFRLTASDPLGSQGNSKGNPASPPLCPTPPDPFTSLVVAVVACKKKGK